MLSGNVRTRFSMNERAKCRVDRKDINNNHCTPIRFYKHIRHMSMRVCLRARVCVC